MNNSRANPQPPGSPVPKRWWAYLSHNEQRHDCVIILFRALLHNPDVGLRASKDWNQVSAEWAKDYPAVNAVCQSLGEKWIHDWFLVGNPSILPLLLADYHHQAIMSEGGIEAANFGLESLADDLTPLGTPNDRAGAANYKKVQARRKASGNSRIDLGSMYRHAEAWVILRHKLVPSLMSFVEAMPTRTYAGQEDDDSDIETRRRNWRRELKKIVNRFLDFRNWDALLA